MRACAIMHTGCARALKSTSTRGGEAEKEEHEDAEEQVSAQGEAQRRPGSRARWPQRPRLGREWRRRGGFWRKECSLWSRSKEPREASLALKVAMMEALRIATFLGYKSRGVDTPWPLAVVVLDQLR